MCWPVRTGANLASPTLGLGGTTCPAEVAPPSVAADSIVPGVGALWLTWAYETEYAILRRHIEGCLRGDAARTHRRQPATMIVMLSATSVNACFAVSLPIWIVGIPAVPRLAVVVW
jgi:hypothetical protein